MARISKEEQARIREKTLVVAYEKFLEHGFENVSTKDIAKTVGIAEGTLFNYFDSKVHLFLESFAEHFTEATIKPEYDIDLTSDLVDIIYNHLEKLTKILFRMPKRILTELMIATIRFSKKRPEQMKKFIELDFKYMADMKQFLDDLIVWGLLKEMDTQKQSEIIYSIVLYEFIMYLYDNEVTKDTLMQNIKTKLTVLLQGYIK